MNAPTHIRIRHGLRRLELEYEDGSALALPAEFLRVHYPVPPGTTAPLIAGKRLVGIRAAEPTGNYALRLRFSDGFETGVYSWTYLRDLGREYRIRWRRYLHRLEQAGLSRE